MAGQRPSSLNASGFIGDGRRTTLSSRNGLQKADAQQSSYPAGCAEGDKNEVICRPIPLSAGLGVSGQKFRRPSTGKTSSRD